jgi:hypothetical protein
MDKSLRIRGISDIHASAVGVTDWPKNDVVEVKYSVLVFASSGGGTELCL